MVPCLGTVATTRPVCAREHLPSGFVHLFKQTQAQMSICVQARHACLHTHQWTSGSTVSRSGSGSGHLNPELGLFPKLYYLGYADISWVSWNMEKKFIWKFEG